MRTVVSYDDLATTQRVSLQQLGPPLSKKRRIAQQKSTPSRLHQQHWDDPGNDADTMNYGEYDGATGTEDMRIEEQEEEEEDESRDLTQEEIWDDSALIEAWNSATAEYEAYHGKGKDWKKEPVKKSPLWYNIPPENASSGTKSAAGPTADAEHGTVEDDSTPISFNTYIPTHDPSLAGATAAAPASAGPESSQYTLSDPSGSNVTANQAFQKALSATYWAGYWTAVYHCQANSTGKEVADADGERADGPDGEEDEDESSADLLTTQR
ncbi:hypothetical protein BC629DRAFT_1580397 [Irpex lacteus]|nr:hypothetical protein BC629DRAFT_1580397 [Irpex lacteus]